MAVYAQPGQSGAVMEYKARYDHWIGGKYVPPSSGQYFENVTPVTGRVFCEIARGNAEDIDKALDAAHAAAKTWNKTSATERAIILNKIADRMEQNLEKLAVAETWDNGKPVRETMAADMPLAIDHFRYFAGAIRAQEGSNGELDHDTVAYHFHEPLGVVGQIIPWNFPILMATWKLAPALAAGSRTHRAAETCAAADDLAGCGLREWQRNCSALGRGSPALTTGSHSGTRDFSRCHRPVHQQQTSSRGRFGPTGWPRDARPPRF